MRVVLLTGASGGIGKAVAERFIKRGDKVICHYNKNKPKIEGAAAIIQADLIKDTDKLFSQIEKEFNGVTVLVNNAGISHEALFDTVSKQEFDKILQVNLTAAFRLSQLASKKMLSQKSGSIINVSSIWGLVGASCEVAYSASKAGLIGLTKALAKELAPSNITVNAVAPGVVDTPMVSHYTDIEKAELKKRILLGRFANPVEIAEAIYFLSNAKYITGEVLRICGGLTT